MGDVQPGVAITIKVSEICITGVVRYINTTKTGFDFNFDSYHTLLDMHMDTHKHLIILKSLLEIKTLLKSSLLS